MSKVSIVVPEIKLQVADLAYLEGLRSNNIHCEPSRGTVDRLVFLGLIEKAKIQPCAKKVAEHEASRIELVKRAEAAFTAKDWRELYSVSSDLHYERDKPVPRDGYILTGAGRMLLSHGATTSELKSGKGCPKL